MGNWVDYRTERGIALITLRDPPVNAYTLEMLQELDQCITDVRFDSGVYVVIITGHGENYFCAGGNITMLREVDAEFRQNFFLYASETFARIERTAKLVIAALNGDAVGGGFELALACDIRIARGDHGTVGLPQVRLGTMPGNGGTQRLARIVGQGRAMQMLIEGQKLSFDQARDYGLINYVWRTDTHAEFMSRVFDYARRLAPPNSPARAMGMLKMAARAGYELSVGEGMLFEQQVLGHTLRTEEVQEGLDAWLEKRPPKFEKE